jgi:NTE family protein
MEFNQDLILQEIPLFTNLSHQEHRLIKERSTVLEYKKGQIIYEEGAPADNFYCVLSGRVVTYTKDAQGNVCVLEYLHRGKYFGIISLLTGEPHSVTAEAYNDTLLLVIKKDNFDFILKKIPILAIDLSQTLSRRIKNKSLHHKTIFESTVVSVFSSYSQSGKTIYALNSALSLKKETHKPVIILDICPRGKVHSLCRKLEDRQDQKISKTSFTSEDKYKIIDLTGPQIDFSGVIKDSIFKNKYGIDLICLDYDPGNNFCIKGLVRILSILVNDYYYLILDLPSRMDDFVFSTLNQSDVVHILSSPDSVDLKRTHNLIKRLKSEFNFQENKIKVIINEYKLSKLSHQQQMELLEHSIYATLPKIHLVGEEKLVLDQPDSEYARVIRRISRQLGDSLVGVVLGVGVGYGFCHIGVLKVIEEEKIPVDIICGASVGAVIAALWATGKSSQEILEITQEFKEPKFAWNLVDLTIPKLGFIKGNRLYKFLKKYLGNKTFYDVKLPLVIVASDVRKKESRILDKGSLVEALMASCAMPGVFLPFRFREEILFDGGVINPLPTEPLFKIGVKKIIAVNVTPSREDVLNQYEKLKKQFVESREIVKAKKRKLFSLKQYFQEKFRTNILEIIFDSIEVMQSELAKKEAQLADIVLHPDTSGLHWLELYRAEDFAKRGEIETRRNLDKIWQVINE